MRHLPIYAFALFIPALAASVLVSSNTCPSSDSSDSSEVTTSERSPCHGSDKIAQEDVLSLDDATDARLQGLWSKHDGRQDGLPVRFYYFHDGGIGLYRYGRVGLNNTNSYTFQTHGQNQGKKLTLKFNKTGRVVTTGYRIERENDRDVLILSDDPYEAHPTKYIKERGAMIASIAPHAPAELQADDTKGPGFDRMWTHVDKFAKGGFEFSIYQFKAPALDGRGVGWHHRGDFNNWSTETLYYRRDGNEITLAFPQRREHLTSTFSLQTTDNGRSLTLQSDPRNYWQTTTFFDGGRSFSDAFANAFGTSDAVHVEANEWRHLVEHTSKLR